MADVLCCPAVFDNNERIPFENGLFKAFPFVCLSFQLLLLLFLCLSPSQCDFFFTFLLTTITEADRFQTLLSVRFIRNCLVGCNKLMFKNYLAFSVSVFVSIFLFHSCSLTIIPSLFLSILLQNITS